MFKIANRMLALVSLSRNELTLVFQHHILFQQLKYFIISCLHLTLVYHSYIIYFLLYQLEWYHLDATLLLSWEVHLINDWIIGLVMTGAVVLLFTYAWILYDHLLGVDAVTARVLARQVGLIVLVVAGAVLESGGGVGELWWCVDGLMGVSIWWKVLVLLVVHLVWHWLLKVGVLLVLLHCLLVLVGLVLAWNGELLLLMLLLSVLDFDVLFMDEVVVDGSRGEVRGGVGELLLRNVVNDFVRTLQWGLDARLLGWFWLLVLPFNLLGTAAFVIVIIIIERLDLYVIMIDWQLFFIFLNFFSLLILNFTIFQMFAMFITFQRLCLIWHLWAIFPRRSRIILTFFIAWILLEAGIFVLFRLIVLNIEKLILKICWLILISRIFNVSVVWMLRNLLFVMNNFLSSSILLVWTNNLNLFHIFNILYP